MESTKTLSSEDFVKLYNIQDSDDKITPIEDAIGFTLVRNYPKNSEYFKDDKKMFIKIRLSESSISGGVEMTRQSKDKKYYTIVSGKEYKKRITGFFFGQEENLVFDFESKKIMYIPENLKFSVNEFIEILVNNHLSDRLFWKRIIGNHFANLILKLIFWLSDRHYNIDDILDKLHFTLENKDIEENKTNPEPFFNYFYITKNILFIFLFISLVISYKYVFPNYTLSNPSLVLFFFLSLSILEKVSVMLDKKIKSFFNKDNNFIYKLHNYPYSNHFKLKFR